MYPQTNHITESDINAFAALVRTKGSAALEPGTYPHRYLQHIVQHAAYYSHVYAHVLNRLLDVTGRTRQELSILDYGTGNGLLGLMACYTGFRKVYLNDLDAAFLQSARQLAAAMDLRPDGCIEGGAPQVLSFFAGESPPDLLAGTDVIEHIYDLPAFVNSLQVLNPKLIIALSTACNPLNPLLKRRFRKIQLRDEWEGGTPEIHPLFAGSPIEPFRVIRRRIIGEAGEGKLSEQELDLLVPATRGLIRKDIEASVQQYLLNKAMPVPPLHPTNTCDPNTGSWSERMLTLEVYHSLFHAAGFSLQVVDGFYNQYDKGWASYVRWMANRLIPFTAHRLAPYIILLAAPKDLP